MKNKKKLISIIITVLAVFGVISVLVLDGKINLTSKDKKIIGETDITKKSYGYPIVSLLSEDNFQITIDAGIYRYGDIDQDGVVGNMDILALKIMIDVDKVGFTDAQIKLADVNEDGRINKKDLELFESYLKDNKEVGYDINSKLLEYCLNDVRDSTSCKWQDGKKFKIVDKRDYYAFVRQKNNGRISDVMELSKSVFERLEI